ncbi:DUF4126 domain-containing protein [Thermocoleostomius sinensis]|uniref:DUF4126 domain-containing protein n=1 Tax=Thermocoleostomius sinensis A174 TaxID=2016057 RepID=A0A9E8ZED4_9CYAN|nr:DUF4126 domain-containing protein [Thermocoleostomius sinensis]WAL61281.1 DUF4126 domain-containing protein [Thermocoleostomius sinensis A174]
METLLSLLLGISLSAACGFRIFVPFLVMSIAALSGHLTLDSGFAWIGSPAALLMFAIATVLEVGGYYIPWLDEILDVIATPTAVVAGTLTTASTITEMSPMLQWTLAIVAGGGAASIIQGLTDITRLTSSLSTGGVANPLLATMELITSTLLSIMAIALPLFTGVIVIGVLVFAAQKLWIFFRRRSLSKARNNHSLE